MYTVMYRDGGTERPRWNRLIPVFKNRRDAGIEAAALELMGYKVIVRKLDALKKIGPPVGWDASNPNPSMGTRYWNFEICGIPSNVPQFEN